MDNHWVQIRAGRSNTKMVGMARANFPQVPEFPTTGAFKISSRLAAQHDLEDHLRHLQRRVALHAQRRAAGAQGRVDGHGRDRRPPPRAHRKTRRDARRHLRREEDADPAQGPRRAAPVCSPPPTPRTLEFADDDQTLFFRVGGRVLTSRKLTGQFPNYEAVLPRDNNKFVIVRSRRPDGLHPARRAVRRRALAAPSRSASNRTSSSCAQSTDAGESEDIIETPYNYDPLVVGFNSQYLVDFLKAIGNTGEVRLEFKDAQSAGQMRPEDANEDVKYRYILMPMRI